MALRGRRAQIQGPKPQCGEARDPFGSSRAAPRPHQNATYIGCERACRALGHQPASPDLERTDHFCAHIVHACGGTSQRQPNVARPRRAATVQRISQLQQAGEDKTRRQGAQNRSRDAQHTVPVAFGDSAPWRAPGPARMRIAMTTSRSAHTPDDFTASNIMRVLPASAIAAFPHCREIQQAELRRRPAPDCDRTAEHHE